MNKIVSRNKKTSNFEKLIETVFRSKIHELYWIAFTGGNVSVLKEWVMHCGVFDEGFGKNWGYEDIELGYRIWKEDKEFDYCEDAANYHVDHYRFHFEEDNHTTSTYFYDKHKDENIKVFIGFSSGNYGINDTIMNLKAMQSQLTRVRRTN